MFLQLETKKLELFQLDLKAKKKENIMQKKITKHSKSIPNFKNEDEEREFWSSHDLTDYLDSFEPIILDLSHLKPSTQSISLRLPSYLLMRIKQLANSRDVPYQSLMKIFLAERVDKELQRKTHNV